MRPSLVTSLFDLAALVLFVVAVAAVGLWVALPYGLLPGVAGCALSAAVAAQAASWALQGFPGVRRRRSGYGGGS